MTTSAVQTHVAPLALDDIQDPELRALIDRAEESGVPGSVFPRILARVPEHAKPMLDAMLHSHFEGGVPHRLKEIIRIALARYARDPYFATLRSKRALAEGLDEATISAGRDNYETDPRFTAAERCALRYADQMYVNPRSIDAAFYAEMKTHYSEPQIMEIGAFIALHYGMQVFMRTLDASSKK